MKRENILIAEDSAAKKVAAVKFTAPGNIPAFDCSIHFGEEPDMVEMQNCIINDNRIVKCSPDDTYDFETGALIALMKMCGAKKAAEACCEAFPHETSGSIYRENKRYIKRIKELEKENERLKEKVDDFYAYNKGLIDEIDKKNHEIISLKALKLTNESLKKDNESFRKTIAVKNRDIDHLLEENKELHKNIDELFESDKHAKSEVGRLSFEKHRLEEKVEKLKLDCEKLQHGYIDTDMIFCGGRQNGKQYTLLVELFKKTPKDKIRAAYKEAYGSDKEIWYTSSFTRDYMDSLIESSRAFTRKCVDEWLYRIPTKRAQMWAEIFALHKESDVIIDVKKEDINIFLHEIENKIPEITWGSGVKIFETKYTIGDIYEELKTCDMIYFRLSKETKLSYSSDSYIYLYRELKHIDYLPPMRWDLFEKGRIVIGCTEEEVPEFREKAKRELGNIRIEKYSIENIHCNGTLKVYYHYDKDTNWLKPLLVSGIPRVKVNNHKVVYWEDVR